VTAAGQVPPVHSEARAVPNSPWREAAKTGSVKRPAHINKPRLSKEALSEASNCEAATTHRNAAVPLVNEPLSFPDRNPYETALWWTLETGEAKEWQQLLQEEFWQPLLISSEKAAGLYEEYSAGLFSPGRPGILASAKVSVALRSQFTKKRHAKVMGRQENTTEVVTKWLLSLNDDGLTPSENHRYHERVVSICLRAVKHIYFMPIIPGRTKREFVADFLTDYSKKFWTIPDKATRESKIREAAAQGVLACIGNACKSDMLDENRKTRAKKRNVGRRIYSLDEPIKHLRGLTAMQVATGPGLRQKAAKYLIAHARRERIDNLRNRSSHSQLVAVLTAIHGCEASGERPDKAVAAALRVSVGHARKLIKTLKADRAPLEAHI
jgi:hypothetical protein